MPSIQSNAIEVNDPFDECSALPGFLNRVSRRPRVPRHVGFIPDGNRRWAVQHGLSKEKGYQNGIAPGVALFEACKTLGIEEVSIFGFTQDNTHRPMVQANHFRAASVDFAREISRRGAALLVLGDEQSRQFPVELAAFRTRQGEGIKVNLLVNYGWEWDLNGLKEGGLRSAEVSRLDLIARWGGGRRLSGFLPVQSVYADILWSRRCGLISSRSILGQLCHG